MGAFAQTARLLTFTSPLGENVLLPEHFSGVEAISELFRYQVDLLADKDTAIDPKDIVGKSVTLAILANDEGTQRYINGIVCSFQLCGGGDDEFNCYRAWIVPSLWALTLNKNTRVFQNQTVTDVIKAVLKPYSIQLSDGTSASYTPMEYCTQYRETDFHFISRLMEQHGILYYFKHSEDEHIFTLQDNSSTLSDCPIQSTLRYAPEPGDFEGYYDFIVQEFSSSSTMVTGKYSVWDYSFIRNKEIPENANVPTKGPLGANGNEQYDYSDSAAAYLKLPDSDGKIGDLATFFMTMRRDAGDAGTVIVEGAANAISLSTGYTFTLSEHPQSSLNAKYLVTRVEHTAEQLPPYRTQTKNSAMPYKNRFTAAPSSIVWRPPMSTAKPVVNGMHTGQVITLSGEESHMDKYGRVNVQFWWDRLRKPNTPDNTLLRVAQPWAGKGWGTYFWPRVGDEVLIDFLEGDPDQPIVVGSVYNGVNMPKYDPTGQYTLSGILTRSSKNGGAANANELRFEDLKDKEQIFMNAERDYDLHVEHDWHTMVGNEQHTTIKKNQFEEVDGDSHRLVKGKELLEVDGEQHLNVKSKQVVQIGADREHKVSGNLKESIGQNSNINVGMNLNEKVGMNYSLQVGENQYNKAGMVYVVDSGQEVHIKGGMNVVIEGGMSVCLSGPGGFVSIGPEGVAISGTMVLINSGGAATPGTPGMPESPQSPSAPTAPTAPTFPGDDPYSQPSSS